MNYLKSFSTNFLFGVLTILTVSVIFSSCNHDDEVRMPEEIMGVWSPNDDVYLEFCDDNIVRHLNISYQDGESIGTWTTDVYYYEPGYNLVIYLSAEHHADVYEIVELSSDKLTWCWVDEINARDAESIGQIIGDIINKAQEGFHLDPELYQTFNKISKDEFLSIIENLDLNYPW